MYLIGNELRHRFVEDADDFLSEDYLISQLHLQTAQDSASILSLQAQMYGLYPASDQNDLTEWQQGNAVPPIEGADFSKWQEELGAHALPHGINTFPIQMFGKDHDWLLAMNEKNCARWESEWNSVWAGKEEWYDGAFAKKFPEAMDHINTAGGNVHDFCNYMEWAHLNGVELSIERDTALNIHQFCNNYTHTRVTMKQGLDDKDSHIMSSMLINDLKNQLTVIKNASSSNTLPVPQVYKAYTALTRDHLSVFVNALFNKKAAQTEFAGLPVASTMFIEVMADSTVRGFVNDRPVPFNFDCESTVDGMLECLDKMTTFSDVESAC